jgi:hypothetical protein
MSNPRDAIRRRLLQALYDMHERGVENELRDVFAARFLAEHPKLKEEQVHSNLRYLVLKGWARIEERSLVSIAAKGIDLMEGSRFHQLPKGRDYLSVPAAGEYAFIGEGDLVVAGREELFRTLGALREGVVRSRPLTQAEKLDAAGDLKALQSLLQKRAPDPAILESLWASASEVASRAGLAEEVERANKAKRALDW